MEINTLLHRKESIILATIEVMDEYGIHNLSTREVAKRVGISEPAIFKHFRTKSDLILAVLTHYSQYDIDIIHSIRAKNLKPIHAITVYIDTYAAYYENYPAITALTQCKDALSSDEKYADKVKEILLMRTNFIKELAEQAQEETGFDSEYFAITVMGLLREWCLHWRLSEYRFSLREKMLASLTMLLDSFTVLKK